MDEKAKPDAVMIRREGEGYTVSIVTGKRAEVVKGCDWSAVVASMERFSDSDQTHCRVAVAAASS